MNQPVKRVYRVADALELTLELERTRFGLRPDALFLSLIHIYWQESMVSRAVFVCSSMV